MKLVRRVLTAFVIVAIAVAGGYGAYLASSQSMRSGARAVGTSLTGAHSLRWTSYELGTAAFSSTACAGPARCLAFGLDGTFATSNDGGRSWILSKLELTTNLQVLAASCASATRCAALAEPEISSPAMPTVNRGIALASRNGGRSWSRAFVSGPAVQFLGGLACPSAQVCYAIAANLGRFPRGFLLVSSDGGARWSTRRQGPAGGLDGALACPTVTRCLATGGRGLVLTNDGGRKWVAEREPIGGGGMPALSALACSSVTTCVGVGTEPSPGYPVIITTGDGGSTWRFIYASASGGAFREIGGGGYRTVTCEGLRCIALGNTFPEIGLVSESADGGRTWRAVSLGDGIALSGASCAPANGCLAAGTTGDGAPVLALGGIGRAWRESYVGPGTNWSALACPSTRHCVAVSGAAVAPVSAHVATSDDGGKRWSLGRLPAGVLGITALSCPTLRHCLAIAEVPAPRALSSQVADVAAFASSDDGGYRWRLDVLKAPPDTLDALSCPSASICFAVGATAGASGLVQHDVVVKTTDGGAEWSVERIPAFPPEPPLGASGSSFAGGGLTSISCFSVRHCVSGGPAGVLETNDGTDWRVFATTPGPGHGGTLADGILVNQLQLLVCPTPSRCIGALTNNNGLALLHVSTDGGRVWQRATSPATFVPSDITCPAISECLAAGSDVHGGAVLESFDGGRRWSAAPLPTNGGASVAGVPSASYTSVSCSAPNHCVALGVGATGEVAIAR